MPDHSNQTQPLPSMQAEAAAVPGAAPGKILTPAARRALAEAQARRGATAEGETLPVEKGGRKGPEPVRYGDWERKGIASDF